LDTIAQRSHGSSQCATKINLRSDHKRAKPRAFNVDSKDVPKVRPSSGVRVRVLAGTFAGQAAPLQELLTPALLLDVHLKESATVEIPIASAQTAFAFLLKGSGKVSCRTRAFPSRRNGPDVA
jgi:redox-sensitive bicupin YhaK (pirin superfamily)